MEKKGTCRQPVGVIGLGGSKHQRVVGGSFGFGTARNDGKNTNSANLIEFYEILPDLAKISLDSMRFCKIRSKSHRI